MFYGLDLNDLQTYRERVNAITPDDIQRVAREYLRPDRLSIVLVGDASVFAKQLAGVGFDQFERIALSDLDLGSADLKRHGPPTNRFQPAAFIAPRRPWPRRHAAQSANVPAAAGVARGDRAGRRKPRADSRSCARSGRSRRRPRRRSSVAPAGPATFDTTSYIQYPGAFRVDATTAAGPVVRVFTPASAG